MFAEVIGISAVQTAVPFRKNLISEFTVTESTEKVNRLTAAPETAFVCRIIKTFRRRRQNFVAVLGQIFDDTDRRRKRITVPPEAAAVRRILQTFFRCIDADQFRSPINHLCHKKLLIVQMRHFMTGSLSGCDMTEYFISLPDFRGRFRACGGKNPKRKARFVLSGGQSCRQEGRQ